MSTEEHQWPDAPSRAGDSSDGEPETIWPRVRVLLLLIAALAVVELTKDLLFSKELGEWQSASLLLYSGLVGGLPFLLAKIAPRAASFEIQWLPRSRWHWLWFAGMLVLLVVWRVLLVAWMAGSKERPLGLPPFGPVTPVGVIFSGIVTILVSPIVEEIFVRGYVLGQLRKLMRDRNALVAQAFLFGLFHIYSRAWFPWLALVASVNAFVLGLIFGIWRIRLRSIFPLVLAHIFVNALAYTAITKANYDWAIAERWHLTSHSISEETTRVTGPLRKDGAVDYVAVLNRRASQGVTPENNAAVLFWQAVGPEEILPEYRPKYFEMLGVSALPEVGEYFVSFKNYLARQAEAADRGDTSSEAATEGGAYDVLEPALKRPWSKADFPAVVAWLAENERPLALVAEASSRPRCYNPMVCGEKTPLIAVLQPAVSVLHQPGDIGDALIARAMLRLGEGRVDEAWLDLLACHRLARLLGQGPTVVEAIAASSVESNAFDGDEAILQHARLTASQATRMRAELDQLPALPKMADKLDGAERFTYLSTVSDYSRHGVQSLRWCIVAEDLFPDDDFAPWPKGLDATIKSLIRYDAHTEVDWDFVLRQGNAWFDRLVEAHRARTLAGREKAIDSLDKDFQSLKQTAADVALLDRQMLENPAETLSERTGQVLLTIFFPDVPHCVDIEDRWAMRSELDKLGFALAAYGADHGEYPAALAELVPDYLAEVPRDLFSDAGLKYRLDDQGCLVYSVGVNGKDDAGKGYKDRKDYDQVDWDDVAVRLPAIEPK